MEKYDIKNKQIGLHNILFASTSYPDYQMDRIILLENLKDLKYDEYVVVEGFHCSCYDFADCEWEAIKYTKQELVKLASENSENEFSTESELDMYNYILKNMK